MNYTLSNCHFAITMLGTKYTKMTGSNWLVRLYFEPAATFSVIVDIPGANSFIQNLVNIRICLHASKSFLFFHQILRQSWRVKFAEQYCFGGWSGGWGDLWPFPLQLRSLISPRENIYDKQSFTFIMKQWKYSTWESTLQRKPFPLRVQFFLLQNVVFATLTN